MRAGMKAPVSSTAKRKVERVEREEPPAAPPSPVKKPPPELLPDSFCVGIGLHSAVIRYRGPCCDGQHVFSFGHNAHGQLGLPAPSEFWDPMPLTSMDRKRVCLIALGYEHTLLAEDHGLYGCGSNEYGQLGMPTCKEVPEPVLIPAFTAEVILGIAAGRAHSIVSCSLRALAPGEEGKAVPAKVLTFGRGTEGCLGLGDREHRATPTEVEFFHGRHILSVGASRTHNVVLDESAVYVFGVGSFGGLCTPLFTPFALYTPTSVPGLTGKAPIMAAAGGHHSLVLCVDGLYGFGCHADGALGLAIEDGSPLQEARRVEFFDQKTVRGIATGRQHTLVLCEDGVYSCGSGAYGQLGLGRTCLQTAEPTLIPFFQGEQFKGHRLVSVHCGCFSSFVLTTKGLYAFGDCRYGKLGTGSRQDAWQPQLVAVFDQFFTPPERG